MPGFGQKIKSMAASASKSASQYMSGGPQPEATEPGQTTTADTGSKFSNVKRRVTESVMTAVGKGEVTEDSVFDSRKLVFEETEKNLHNLRKRLIAYLEALRLITFSCSETGAAVREAFTGVTPPHASQIESFAAGLNTLDSGSRVTLDERYLADIITPLDELIRRYTALHETFRGREYLKIDFDARLRKLKSLRQSGTSGDPTIIPTKEAELQHNAQSLDSATTELYRQLDALEKDRLATLTTLLQKFAAVQKQFFSSGLSSVSSLPELLPGMVVNHPGLPKELKEPQYKEFIHGTSGLSSMAMGAPSVTSTTATSTVTTTAPIGTV